MNVFEKYFTIWDLTPDGELLRTQSSCLLPVRYKNIPAMLKIATISEEQSGGLLMLWWNGEGAARVLEHDHNAFLIERAIGSGSLVSMAKNHQDDEASRIICAVVNKLHAHKTPPLPSTLVPLSHWFQSLESAKKQHEDILIQASAIAHELLNAPQDSVVLHGDIHHGNILDFGSRGWLAIDPKGLLGERGFDFANIFCNPDIDVALQPGRLEHQATIIAEMAKLDRSRLIKWIIAYAGLSAAWHFEDGSNPEVALAIAKIALSILHP